MNINVTDGARPRWIDFTISVLTTWRPRAVATDNRVLVALTDCALQTKDRAELEACMHLYIISGWVAQLLPR